MKKIVLSLAVATALTGCKWDISSLGADGWAAVDGPVTGGEGSEQSEIFVVTNRQELITALYGSEDASLSNEPSHESKLIYIKGTIDLAENTAGISMSGDQFMQSCPQSGYQDYDAFYADYRDTYNPLEWNKQDLASNGRPIPVHGFLEEMRACFQKAQQNPEFNSELRHL